MQVVNMFQRWKMQKVLRKILVSHHAVELAAASLEHLAPGRDPKRFGSPQRRWVL